MLPTSQLSSSTGSIYARSAGGRAADLRRPVNPVTARLLRMQSEVLAGYVNRLTKARAVSATSRQPLSLVRACPRFLISMISVGPGLSCCCL